MKLYLVRHGEAINIAGSLEQQLSEEGRQEIRAIGNFLGERRIFVEKIYHSGKFRAKQTAEQIATSLQPVPSVETLIGLQPNDPIEPIALYCNNWQQEIMLVGHLPFMARLASELIFNRERSQFIDFQTAAVLCLERVAIFQWCISWFINPTLCKVGSEDA